MIKHLLQLTFYICLISLEPVQAFNLETIQAKFQEERLSIDEINSWLNQFDEEDRNAAILLLDKLDYFSYKRLSSELALLHQNVLFQLNMDGFIENIETEMRFDRVDFSKTLPAKSGDLISYFYRNANKIRAVCFHNLGDLAHDNTDKSKKALIILDDYISTGTQFLFVHYANKYSDLFNQYKKVYFVVPVANVIAIQRFEMIKNGKYEALAQEFIATLNIQEPSEKRGVLEQVRRIPSDKLEIIFSHEEISLLDKRHDEETVKKISALLNKYNIIQYLGRSFSTYGNVVFFYNCPNNLPELLWNTKSIKRDGSPWIPLFKRFEDLSIYPRANYLPIEEQIW